MKLFIPLLEKVYSMCTNTLQTSRQAKLSLHKCEWQQKLCGSLEAKLISSGCSGQVGTVLRPGSVSLVQKEN